MIRHGSRTPWGATDHVEKLADGIYSVSTPGHGGIWLDQERRNMMPPEFVAANFLGTAEWWEEDCDWSLVAITFPEAFARQPWHPENYDPVSAAVDTAAAWHTDAYAAVMDRAMGGAA
jgi:hypothetical protein